MPRRPHKLALYEQAVQHPLAEVGFLERAFEREHGTMPTLLREDFAGTCSVAAAWCDSHPDRQAMAVEHHGPTLRWATRRHRDVDDLHPVEADVLDIASPRVDVVAALNFSTFIYHDRAALLRYFKHARRCLRKPGVLVIDAYGGPGAMRPGTQSVAVPPGPVTPDGFTYHWEQRSFDAVSAKVDCRIHFEFADGTRRDSAFRYDWRLWTVPELIELMGEAGFSRAAFWCDRYDAEAGVSDGRFKPRRRMDAREDWVGYVVGVRA